MGGVIIGFTIIDIVVVLLQAKSAGVKVYVVVEVLLIAGDQVPIIPLVDVVGNASILAPE